MITVLQRQHVRRRAVPPARLRARNAGVRWSEFQHAAAPRRGNGIFAPPVPRKLAQKRHTAIVRLPRAERRRKSRQEHPERRPRGAVPLGPLWRLAASPWLLIGLLVVLGTAFLLPAIHFRGISLPAARPLLPAQRQVDQELYRMLIPEEPLREAAKIPPALLTTLKIVRYATREGDSISSIAQRFRLNLDTVISWNGIRDAHSIPAGTSLEIPNANGLKYHVRRGDTLEGIARGWSIALNEILDWNRLSSSVISVGQDLFLPGARMSVNELNRILGSLFIFPARGRISSFFGNRNDPFTGVVRFHNGIDIVSTPGSPVTASMAGTVRDVGFNNNFGRYIIISHSGYQSMYAHLQRSLVSRGERVQQGEKIGEVGTTGYSTGPHLHFSIFRSGEAVDPLRFLK